MTITFEIPEELASHLIAAGEDPARAALEAIALEGYRRDCLTEAEIRVLLGFATRWDVHRFLKEHGACMPYSEEDLEADSLVATPVARRALTERDAPTTDERLAG